MTRWKRAAVLVVACTSMAAHPQSPSDRGRDGAQVCAACHGLDGNTTMAPNTPRLAGQLREFLALQLRHYASGERQHPLMSPIAKGLSPEQVAEVAEWYAAQPPKAPGAASGAPEALQLGERLYAEGKPGAPACRLCHGAKAQGMPPAAARLAGQYADYLVNAMDRYRKGMELKAAASLVMRAVIENLDDTEVRAVAQYLQTMR